MNFNEFAEYYFNNYFEETFAFWLFLTSLTLFFTIKEIRNKPTSIYDFTNNLEE
jgi:hypothetical protein